jgi:hypothetical protein
MMTNQLRDERLRLQQQNQGNYNRMLDMMDPSRWGNWGSPASTTGQAAPYYLSNQPASNWGMPGGYGFPQSGTAPAQGSSGMSTIPGANSSVPDYTTEAY